MTPAPARAEFESWIVPELSAAIEYPLEVMDEIRAFACDELLQLSHGGREVGGVMFGVRRDSGIRILTWRPIVCECAFGESFRLSRNDRLGLAVQLERARVDPNLRDLRPVGWFVAHPRGEVSLAKSDQEVYESFFPESWQVTLVMHPAGGGVSQTGFFVRHPDGSLKTDASYREFALQPLHATPGSADNTSLAPATAPPGAETPSAVEPAPALQTPNFQIAQPLPSKERWLWAVPIGLALALAALLLYHRQTAPAATPAPPLPEASQASSGPIGQAPSTQRANTSASAARAAPPGQPADSIEVLQLRSERDQLAGQVQQRDAQLLKERTRADQQQNLVRILENRLNIKGDAVGGGDSTTPAGAASSGGTSHLK